MKVVSLGILLLLVGCASSDRMMRLRPQSSARRDVRNKASRSLGLNNRNNSPDIDKERVSLWPLVHSENEFTSVLWPMIDYDKRGMAVRPFYNKEDDKHSVLFPLSAWSTEDKQGWVLTYVWDRSRKFWGVIPLFWKEEANGQFNFDSLAYCREKSATKSSWFLPPILTFGWKGEEGRGFGNFPLFYLRKGEGEQLLLSPICCRMKSEDEGVWIIPPLLSAAWHSYDEKGFLAFPLCFYAADEDEMRFTSLPYCRKKTENGSFWVLPLCLAWAWRDADEKGFAALPFCYLKTDDEGREFGSLLYCRGKGEKGEYLVVPPLLFASWDTEREKGSCFLPVYYNTSQNKTGGEYTKKAFLFNLCGYASFLSKNEDVGRNEAYFFPLFWQRHRISRKSRNETGELSLLASLLYEQKSKSSPEGESLTSHLLLNTIGWRKGTVNSCHVWPLLDYNNSINTGVDGVNSFVSPLLDFLTLFEFRKGPPEARGYPRMARHGFHRKREFSLLTCLYNFLEMEKREMKEPIPPAIKGKEPPGAPQARVLSAFDRAKGSSKTHSFLWFDLYENKLYFNPDGSCHSLRKTVGVPLLYKRKTRNNESRWNFLWLGAYGKSRKGNSLFPGSEQDYSQWKVLLGAVDSRWSGDTESFSVFRYLYNYKRVGKEETRDIFPFITYDKNDEAKTSKMSVFWRLWNYESDGQKAHGHVFFIPWGDTQ